MRRGPPEQKRSYAGGSGTWHCLVRGRLTDRAEAAGDSPAGARVWDEVRAPPGAQHSVSLKAITARQLQALVRRPAYHFRSCAHGVRNAATEPCTIASPFQSGVHVAEIGRASCRETT